MEELLESQFSIISQVRDLIKESSDKLDQLDKNGAFKADDEIGWFFNNIKYIQDVFTSLLSSTQVLKPKNKDNGQG